MSESDSDSDSNSDASSTVSSRAASQGPATLAVSELQAEAQAEAQSEIEQAPTEGVETGQIIETISAAQVALTTDDAEAQAQAQAQAEVKAEEPDAAKQQQLGPDAKPLHITHDVTPKLEDGREQPSIGVDIVVIHGVYGDWQDESDAGTGSASSTWVHQYRESLSYPYRVMRFEHEPLKLFAGRRSREAVRKCALKLLRALVAVRQYDSSRRFLIFVMHDIGGIIVKDALAAAALDRNQWMDIYEMSRILVFMCCPHRSQDHLDMEERLCRFLYATYKTGIAEVRPSISSISGFAAAITEVNGLFVESKIPLRSRVLSVYGSLHRHDMNSVFDEYHATLGVPLEKRFQRDSESNDYTDLTKYLSQLKNDLFIPIDDEQHQYERRILALSSPVWPLQSPKMQNIIEDSPVYKSWLNNPGPQILHLHGTDRVRDVAEQVFYSLEDLSEKSEKQIAVLYFSFDRWDIRCDSWRDMLSTFVAQLMCHYPRYTNGIKEMIARLSQERGWTEADLVYWFDRVRVTAVIQQVFFVANFFDESIKGSYKLFLENFAYLAQASEAPWKVVVTSRRPGALSHQLSNPWAIDIDLSTLNLEASNTNHFERDMTRLMKLRPDLFLLGNEAREELLLFEGVGHLEKQVIWEQARVNPEWPDKMTIQEIFGPLDGLPDQGRQEHNLEQLLQWVLSRLPDQTTLRRILTWLLYAVRPLTIWELATVMYLGSEYDRGDILPSASALNILISNVQTWFAGLVNIEHNEVRIRHPRLRNILMGNDTKFLWGEIDQSAHFEIAKLCLEYLSRAGVKELIDSSFHVTDAEAFETPTFADRGNLCSYALQAWAHHFLLTPQNDELHQLLMQHASSEAVSSWARGYWCLSNPVTRSRACLRTLFPVFAGLGCLDVLEPRDEVDAFQGLLEAASKGQAKTVQSLLAKTDCSESDLMDVLVASSASGNELFMLELLELVISKSETPSDISWPPTLLHRASWLGLDRFAGRILDLGCPPDAHTDWQSIIPTSPLSQGVFHFHSKIVRSLLKHNADVHRKYIYDNLVIHQAASVGNAEITKILVEEGKAELESTNERGFTAVYFASLAGNHHALEILLDLGADPNMGSGDVHRTWTPIVVAADRGFKQCVELLLTRGADPNIPAKTALVYAALRGHIHVCRLLLDNGADPNLPNPPILIQMMYHFAGSENQQEIFNLLLSYHADASAKDSSGTSVLTWAARSKSPVFFVQKLLEHGADVDATNSNNETALHWVTRIQAFDLVELLLERNPNVNIVDSNGVTPLYLSLSRADIAHKLLRYGADPDKSRWDGFTCLMYTAYHNYPETAEHLIAHNATLDVTYEGSQEVFLGSTALSMAVIFGSSQIVRLFAEAGSDMKHVSADGIPILHRAATKTETLSAFLEFPSRIDIKQTQHHKNSVLHLNDVPLENFKRLVNAGADIDAQNTSWQDTPLSIAAFQGNIDCVQYLLSKGADVNLGSFFFGSPLIQACHKGHFPTIKLLVEKGASINQSCPNVSGTPLGAACIVRLDSLSKGCEEIVEYLISHGADPSTKAGLCGYALNNACLAGRPSLIRLLLAKGATTNVQDDLGRSPLIFAALNGIDHYQIIKDTGVDLWQRDKMKRSVISFAAQAGRLQVVKSIHPIEEMVNDTDIDGWSPLMWALRGMGPWPYKTEESKQIDVIRFLLEKGADRKMAGTVGNERWTPVKIARFHGQSSEVIELLQHGLKDEEKEAGTEEESEDDKSLEGYLQGATCDACESDCRGYVYTCTVCHDYDVCWKCYCHKDLFHDRDHDMEKQGPQFADAPDGTKDDNSSDTSDSDSDSDSEWNSGGGEDE